MLTYKEYKNCCTY